MDANKRLRLIEIGYRILPVCGTCIYGRFANPNELFGTCAAFNYIHQKHSNSLRELSVHRAGSCDQHEMNPGTQAALHGFKEFVR